MNLFDLPELPLQEERVDALLQSGRVRIERIVSTGQTSDWYDQEQAEWVALLQGEATILYEDGQSVNLKKGDTLLIPAHVRHRVSHTSVCPACIWLCMFYSG